MQACKVVCQFIAPNDGETLFNEMQMKTTGPSSDLIALMCAYREASSKNVKRQILSIYAYCHTMKTLQAYHEPYEKISIRQIKLARSHAKKNGPGAEVPKIVNHRVRLDTNKVDHFVDFINRPYFYQDVAFGTRKLSLSSGLKITMPNVVRTVTRCYSTMVLQYLEHCQEEGFEPISRSTMYRILEVREASQRKSLSGLDNTAAEGVVAFERLNSIIDELSEAGADKEAMLTLKEKLKKGKNYLKKEYMSDCGADESECADHCWRFALSDPKVPEFQSRCISHTSHEMKCNCCEELKVAFDLIENSITDQTSSLYSEEQRDDLLYDFNSSKNKIMAWKSHILREANQENAKQDVLRELDNTSMLIVADWAMKFVQMRIERSKVTGTQNVA